MKKQTGAGGTKEVEYKTKSGTAWSHSYLNQKPWHPLSYPNQRRKWIAEQTHAERARKSEVVSREPHATSRALYCAKYHQDLIYGGVAMYWILLGDQEVVGGRFIYL